MNKSSAWAVIECKKCNEIFSVPSVIILEDGEDYEALYCPCCGKYGGLDTEDGIKFIIHSEMNCNIKKVSKWEIE